MHFTQKELEIKKLLTQCRKNVEHETCPLCGRPIKGACNSHSVPQVFLKELGSNDKICSLNALSSFVRDVPIIPTSFGLNCCSTFHLICSDCDRCWFKDYENVESIDELVEKINGKERDKILAEIMLKSSLLEIYKKTGSKNLTNYENEHSEGLKISPETDELNLMEYGTLELRCKGIIESNSKDNFVICYIRKVQKVSHFVGQPLIAIHTNMDGSWINEVFKLDENYHLVDTQFVIFPYNGQTLLLAYCLKEDYERQKKFFEYLNGLNEQTQSKLLQAVFLAYSEEIYTDRDTIERLTQDNVAMGFQEQNVGLSFGGIGVIDDEGHKLVFPGKRISLNGYRKMKLIMF